MDHQAFAQLLGNYGEFVGAIAVVVTLAYLAVQVRVGNTLARRAEMNMGHDQMTQLRLLIASQREIAQLVANGNLEPSGLDSVDLFRYDAIAMTYFRCGFQAWDRARKGLLEQGEWVEMQDSLQALVATKGGGLWWTNNKHAFLQEFQQALDVGDIDQS